ncbi:MAG: phosphatase PAP2 family protein [Prolixibacteraceae bacterium]|jgi:membrane-associated phospholipid phosphatase|nr:phosphatase PAP2 family protein [Prolixibacteraceae bacterium]NLO01747.1 phosphatase PAP2 family protein [Bacteroidales bacterium]
MRKLFLLNSFVIFFCCSVNGNIAAPDTITEPVAKKAVLKPYIAPAVLISSGTIIHFMDGTKSAVRDFMQDNLQYNGQIDDYAQYAPLVTVYALNLFGINGKNNFGNRTALAAKSMLLNGLITDRLKNWTDTERPNGEKNSFPSGHTSKAFTVAHFMHRELGDISYWYSIGAYSCATAVGVMRLAKNAHWMSDVLAGAGIGILSTELVYLTHQYKWDNKHIRKLDILPFQFGKNKGISFVYTF